MNEKGVRLALLTAAFGLLLIGIACALWLQTGKRARATVEPGARRGSDRSEAALPSADTETRDRQEAQGSLHPDPIGVEERGSDDSTSSLARSETSIVGTVFGGSGAPVAGAHVRVECSTGRSLGLLVLSYSQRQDNLGETTTNSQGRFRLPARTGQAHRLTASFPGLASEHLRFVPAGSDVEIHLSAAASLAGYVLFADGTPLANGDLRGWDRNSRVDLFRGTTDGRGEFFFGDLPTCAARVDIESAAGAVPWYEIDLVAGKTTHLNVTVPMGVRVFGRVTSATDGEPIAEARVGLGWTMDMLTHTDQDGRYEILHYAGVGHFDMAVEADGFGRREAALVKPEGEDLRRDFQLYPGLGVEGRVVDQQGTAISGAAILCQGEGYETLDLAETSSDSQGFFSLNSLRPDLTHILVFQQAQYAERVIDLVGEPSQGRIFQLGNIELSPPASLKGKVVDEQDEPWPGILVMITDTTQATREIFQRAGIDDYSRSRFARRVWTDDLGLFRATGLGSGQHEVSAKVPDSSIETKRTVSLSTAKKMEEIKLVLPQGNVVRGVVQDESGKRVSGARIQLFGAGSKGSTTYTYTQRDGSFLLRITDNSVDKVDLQAEQPSWGLAPGSVRLATVLVRGISPIANTPQTIVLPRAVLLAGLVVEPDGSPANHAMVEIDRSPNEPYEWNGTTTSDAEGHFQLWVAPQRELSLSAWGMKRDEKDISGYTTDEDNPRRAASLPLKMGTDGREGVLLQLIEVKEDQ